MTFYENDFSAADGSETDFTGYSGGQPQRRGGELEAEFNFAEAVFYQSADPCTTQAQYVEATIITPSSQQMRGLNVMGTGPGGNVGYGFRKLTFDGSGNYLKNGSNVASFTCASADTGTPEVWRIEATESGGSVTIIVYRGGVAQGTPYVDSSSILSGTYCGGHLEHFGTGCAIQDWEHGDIPPPPDLMFPRAVSSGMRLG